MADCYFHGYSGGPGPCPQCERENNEDLERGSLPMTLDPSVVQDLANISSIGRKAAAEQARRAHKDKKDK